MRKTIYFAVLLAVCLYYPVKTKIVWIVVQALYLQKNEYKNIKNLVFSINKKSYIYIIARYFEKFELCKKKHVKVFFLSFEN